MAWGKWGAADGRKELKHAITRLDCQVLRSNMRHVMQADPHAGEDGTYFIRSVYFDNLDNKVLAEKKEGLYNRDKYRVRLYDFQSGVLYLEKKSKRNNLTFKEKCRLTPEEYERLRRGEVDWMEADGRGLVRELYLQMHLLLLKPVTVVDYNREVYIYEYGNVRVTFDSHIKTSFRNDDLLNPHLPMVEALDPNLVVLEIKYDAYLPDVIRALLQVVDRRKEAFSKYQLSRMYG